MVTPRLPPHQLYRTLLLLGSLFCSVSWQGLYSSIAQTSNVTVLKSVRASLQGDTATVFVRAEGALTEFQRPERTSTGWVLRFPKSQLRPADVDSSARIPALRCVAEQIRSFAVVRVMTTITDTVIIKRIGPSELAFTFLKRLRSASELRAASEPRTPVDERKPVDNRWSLDVIVIDAGHGGQDFGAEGVNGVYEKDVTLSIAKKLRDALRRDLPGTKVVMTRDHDVFIELYRRTQIANEVGGKLFMSIHCNSMPTKPHPAHGCETYILRPGRNDDAARVAQRENASVRYESSTKQYQSMTEDQIIVATMAQRSFVRLSEVFASTIQEEVTGSCPLADRGVSQAGFYVLVGASMPNVLVETGFLSNITDAQYLASQKGQNSIANSLARAVTRYAREYQRSIQR